MRLTRRMPWLGKVRPFVDCELQGVYTDVNIVRQLDERPEHGSRDHHGEDTWRT